MSFLRHEEIYHFDEGAIPPDHALAHRNDEFPAGYSLAGCAPAVPAAASPADAHLARKGFRGTMQFQRTVSSALTVCLTPGDKPTLAYTIRLSEMVQKIPETSKNPLGFAYVLLLPFVMTEIGEFTLRHSPSAISLIHDRCSYDVALLQMFNQVINDPGFAFRESFTTLAPMCWQKCVSLQPADLMAYENFKEGERHLSNPRDRRKSLKRLVEYGQIGGKLCMFDADTLGLLKERLDSMSPAAKALILEIVGTKRKNKNKRNKT